MARMKVPRTGDEGWVLVVAPNEVASIRVRVSREKAPLRAEGGSWDGTGIVAIAAYTNHPSRKHAGGSRKYGHIHLPAWETEA